MRRGDVCCSRAALLEMRPPFDLCPLLKKSPSFYTIGNDSGVCVPEELLINQYSGVAQW